jgi:endonuclease/exonuclease/phosphatase family metal-dependent hydrolase
MPREMSRSASSMVALVALIVGCGAESASPDPSQTSASSAGGGGGAGGEATGGGGSPTTGVGGSSAGGSPPSLRVMSYNIKHADLSSLEEIASVVLDDGADIVALQEVDKDAPRSGNVFQSYRLGQLTGMASSFRAALTMSEGGEYGLAVLSRFPILSSEKLELTSGNEQRILVVWRIALPSGEIALANTHFGLGTAEREVQAQETAAMLAGEPLAILLGDLNEEPGGTVETTMSAFLTDVWLVAGDGTPGYTIPATTPNRRIDYIFVASGWDAPFSAKVIATTASDHRPVAVSLPR